ncbi:CBM35 domain-containing protein [Paenibacillus alkalitolerans]|uniref:CBM35 domain-containing protein n=1 Tax=Paenibacillus alkalitolerans TaxID=2799335 RepID=UPI0018F69A06|nr:CBM35 domain-containing protein [Paenibacillus alkalitolerans]
MDYFKKGSHGRTILFSILCFMVAMTGFIGFGPVETARAEISPLITSYKPQVVNTDVEASYTDANGNTITATIHHPGIAMRQVDLDNMRDHVRAGDEPWNTAFNAFASDSQSSKDPRIYYEEGNDIFINIRGPWPETVDGVYYENPSEYATTRANTDAKTAFHQAIMWYITGDETYRSKAMYIIRAYSGIQSVVEHTNFRLATVTYLLAAAAEILRYSDTPTESEKWTESDTQNLTNMMDLCSVTYNAHSFFMNQHQFTVMGTIGRAIFTNDLELYAEAVEAATVNAQGNDGGRNGSIKHQMRWMTENEMTGEPLDPSDYHVQLVEMGRDQGHTYADIAGLSTLAQTINAQGTKVDPVTGAMSTAANAVNAFNFLDDRLLEGTTYALKYHLGYEVLWTPAWANQSSTIQYFEKINPWPGRGRFDPYLSVLYNYYKYIDPQDMTQEKYKYLAYAYETRMPEVSGKDYPLATLLYTPDAAKADGLSNRIVLGKVSGLTASKADSNAINLSWTAVPDALGYNIYRTTSPDSGFTKITDAPVTGTSYTDAGLTLNTSYYYKVEVAGGSMSGQLVAELAQGGELLVQAYYEAEDAELSGAKVVNDSSYSGTGYADYVNDSGDYVEWTVNASEAGTYTLTFGYVNGSTSDRPLEIKVNGNVVDSSLSFPPTGDWSTISTVRVAASLNAGNNTVRATAIGSSGGNVDYLVLGSYTEGPTVPANLSAAAVSSSQIDLTWDASTDSEGVDGYKVYRDGVEVGSSTTTSYSDTGIAAYTAYNYTVKAYDAAGNLSMASNTATATTLMDPSWIYEAEDAVLSGAMVVTDSSYSGTGYVDYVNASGDYVEWTVNASAAGTYTLTFGYVNGSTSDRPLEIKVNGNVVDSSLSFPPTGDWSTISTVSVTASLNAGDNTVRATAIGYSGGNVDYLASYTEAPTAPANLSATAVSSSQIDLTWDASTDNGGVAGYKVYRDGVEVGSSTTTSYSDTGLAASTAYNYTVKAYDAEGNLSKASITATATTFYEAEDAVLSGAVVSNQNSGYSGTGYADYTNASGDYVEWTVNASTAGTYTITIGYANGGSTDRPLEIKVNGNVVVSSLSFPPTGSWSTWSTVSFTASLNAGNNTVRATAIGSSGGNVDYLVLGN